MTGPRALSRARLAALAVALERIERTCDVESRLAVDPVGVVRRYHEPREQELVGLLASSLAFGNVKALRGGIEEVLRRLGVDLLTVLDDRGETMQRLKGFKYRMIQGHDIGRLLVGARKMQRSRGSLGDAFASELAHSGGSLRPALVAWTLELRKLAGLGTSRDKERRGPGHVLPDPAGTSGCKRLMLYLRWMVRPDDGVDLGVWRSVPPSVLLVPVDTHIHRLGVNLGLTQRSGPSWHAAEEITAVLRKIDPQDPVRFDFALCHLGMARGCQGVADDRCLGCGAQDVCLIAARGRPRRS